MTLFANRLDDAIANVTLGQGRASSPASASSRPAANIASASNLDAIAVRGIEVDGRLDLGRWSLSGGYSFVDSEVEASGAAAPLDGLRPAQTPRHSARLDAGLAERATGLGGSLTARYTGNQYEDDLNHQRLPAR